MMCLTGITTSNKGAIAPATITRRQLLTLAGGATLLGLCGCLRGSANPKPAGMPLVVLIIDRTGSTLPIQQAIGDYVKAALDDYAREDKVKVLLISLIEKPSVDFQRENITADDVDEIVGYVKKMNLNARGTDVVGAFETALKYYGYEKQQPSAFKILCLTDGFIDSPKGQKFHDWKDFDWARLDGTGASVGFYFIDPAAREKVELAAKRLRKSFVREKNDALYDLKQDEIKLP